MEINHNLAEVLNDLIKINNDRIEGYQKAIEDAGEKDLDLKAIFSRMVDESRCYIADLSHEVLRLGEEPSVASSTVSGKIYRTWHSVKTAFASPDRLALLEFCETGENATLKAYKDALISDDTLSIDIRQLIAKQKDSLKLSYDTIRRFKEVHKKTASDDLTKYNGIRSSAIDLRSEIK